MHVENQNLNASATLNGQDVFIALSATSSSLDRAAGLIFLWRCFAARHRHYIQIDFRDPLKERPPVIGEQFTVEIGERYRYHVEKYFSAHRALDLQHKWIILVEPDQVVDPYCWSIGFHDIINRY